MAHHDEQRLLIEWLNDAYGMENGLVTVLEAQAKRTEHLPSVNAKIREHLEVTKNHARNIGERMAELDARPSTIKKGIGKIMGQMSGLVNAMSEDELVKNAIADYSAEHFEIASYKALIALTERMGDQRTREMCERHLREEEEMARWLEQHMPEVVRLFLDEKR